MRLDSNATAAASVDQTYMYVCSQKEKEKKRLKKLARRKSAPKNDRIGGREVNR